MESTLSFKGNTLRDKLAQYLLRNNMVTELDLNTALESASNQAHPLENVLIAQHKITEAQLADFLALTYNTKVVEPSKTKYDVQLLDILPDEFIEEKRTIPVFNSNGRLIVAMVDPGNRSIISEIILLTGIRPQVLAITDLEFWRWWQTITSQLTMRARGNKRKQDELLYALDKAKSEQRSNAQSGTINLEAMQQQKKEEMNDPSNALSVFVTNLLVQGIEQGVSDIHIEPREARYVVRFRSDGILKAILEIPQAMESSVITRLKVMASMDISDHRRPQDGRMSIKWKEVDYNIRVNSLPVTDGREKIVMRILRPAKSIVSFEQLGFTQANIDRLEVMYKAPYGIVLVCGPTGSGKSTTLYTVLNTINNEMINISTVEDPVELKLEGLNQSQVNAKADFTFARSMRALLRQDPDVIMVGEIRDYETLEAGIHAALTGHLVFSTIHANSSATTITRMLEMGASASLISAALNGVIAQRLVRQLCPHCKEPYHANEVEKLMLMTPEGLHEDDLVVYKAKGCDHCKGSGYLGRVGLYEIMSVSREIRQLIAAQANDLDIEDAAVQEGMQTLEMSAKEKITLGLTDFKEIERVLGPIFNANYQHH
ncbi:MAG: GspE/PulE family protein [Vampirovibrionales bacterium]